MRPNALLDLIEHRIDRAVSRVRGACRLVLAAAATDGRVPAANVTGLGGEVDEAVEVFGPYGLSSRAPAGAEAVAVQLGGPGGPLVIVGLGDRSDNAPTGLLSGETAIYASSGATVKLCANGDVEVTPGDGGKVLLAGGGAGVARDGDTVTPSAGFTTWLSAAATALQSLAGVPLPASTSSNISSASAVVEAG